MLFALNAVCTAGQLGYGSGLSVAAANNEVHELSYSFPAHHLTVTVSFAEVVLLLVVAVYSTRLLVLTD
jgi:hypothetical protein